MLTEKEKKMCRMLIGGYKKKLKNMYPAIRRCLRRMLLQSTKNGFIDTWTKRIWDLREENSPRI